MQNNALLVVSIIVMSMLAGCTIGPDYVRPTMNVPASFKEAQAWKPAEPADQLLRGSWWDGFGDAQLSTLMQELTINNQTIAQAEAQYRQSLALYAGAAAAHYPTLAATANQSRGTNNSTTTNGSAPKHSYTIAVSANWETDLWGKLKRAVEASQANVAASAADLAAACLSAQAQLVTTYLQWAVTDAQKRSLEQSVSSYQQQLEDSYHLFNAGVAARADVLQAESQLKSTQAEAIDKGLQREQLQHALAALIGKTPAELMLKPIRKIPIAPAVPLSMPSTLLERRPDIAAAERQVAVANAQIGVASAAYFPDLSLSASGGYKGGQIAAWFSAPSRFWSLGPSLAMSLFDGGARRAQTDQALASYDQAVAAYRQTVLTAFQEVEDSLAAVEALKHELHLRRQAWEATVETETIARNQYRAGTVAYLNVLVAVANRHVSERYYYDTVSRHLTASVSLIRALGGSWQYR